jgi:GGDEF domain-containing protein/CBS domain-containing protein
VLGIPVIAEGVETEAEFRICREIGCELVQGYFIARPSTGTGSLQPCYEIVAETNRTNRRERQSSSMQLRPEIDYLEPISRDTPMPKLLQIFRGNRHRSFFPVIDERHYPLGVVHERDIKEFAYSPFGKDLLNNSHSPFKLPAYITPCLSCDVNTPVERVLSAFALQSDTPAILVVEEGRYIGMLHANALIRLMNERNVMLALNENPLTRLPGNISIDDYLVNAFADEGSAWNLAYFDLDNFKPFNDRFGFRQGDRAILLFAQLLRNEFKSGEVFLGHIGGDDFFAGARNIPVAVFVERIRELLAKFREDASSFYDAGAREAGFTTVRDREGREVEVPLLSASCAMLALPATPRKLALDAATTLLADLKKHAKKSAEKFALADFGG